MELGGKCPLVIDENANMDFTATKVGWGKTVNSGQICIAPDYVFVHESRAKEFIESVTVKIKQMYGEKPEGSEYMGKMINTFHTERVQNLIKGAGGTLVCGGTTNLEAKHIEPTLILEPDLNSELMKEEIFGPIMPIFPYKKIDDVINFINGKEKPLAIYYFGDSGSMNCGRLMNMTRSGAFVANDIIVQIMSNYTSFGGVGNSGYGRHGGFAGF